MDATTSMAVARGRLDDRRWANQARPSRQPATHAAPRTGERWAGRLGALATVVAACALFASVPGMAGAPAATDGQPRPMPAPAPVAAAAITSALLPDARFGA